MNRLIRLTPERLEKAKTPKGGYKASQLKILGVDYPPKKGWKKQLEGKKISLGDFIAFVTKGKNTEYLEQIRQSLPLLNTPVIIPLAPVNDKKKLKQPKFSKKEQKEIKRLQLKNARVVVRPENSRHFSGSRNIASHTELAISDHYLYAAA